MNKIFICCRVSDEKLSEGEGLDNQEKDLRKFISRYDKYRDFPLVVKRFTQSSTEPKFLSERPDLMEILNEIKTGDIIAYWNMERLSRDAFVRSEFIQRLLHRHGVRYQIISDKEYDLRNESDLMIQGIYSNVKHKQTREDILRKLNGKNSVKLRGGWVGGFPPLGYWPEKFGHNFRFIIDEERKGLYLRIVYLFLVENKTCAEIAGIFNGEKITTCREVFLKRAKESGKSLKGWKDGGWWRDGTVRAILTNPIYKGCLVDRKTREVVSDNVPALISEQDWQRIQDKSASRRRHGPLPMLQFLLRDMLYCGRCGRKLLPRWAKAKRKGVDYERKQYNCSGRHNNGKLEGIPLSERCTIPLLFSDKIEEIVWNRTCHELLTLDGLKAELKRKIGNEDDHEKIKSQITEHEADIKRLETGSKDLMGLVASGHWSAEEVRPKLEANKAMKAEKRSVVEALKDKLSQGSRLEETVATFTAISQQLKASLWEYTPEEKRKLLEKVVKRITIDCVSSQGCKDWRKVKKAERNSWNREDWLIDIEYVYNVSELSDHLRLQVGFPTPSQSNTDLKHLRLQEGSRPSSRP